jgi:GNAT superfamily N-acetyltransferase
MRVQAITTEETIALRHLVLRPQQPRTACFYDRDHEAKHFGAYSGSGALVSVVTAHPEDNPRWPVSRQWRIRGMATHPGFQGQGYGSMVLDALLAWGRMERIPLFWCNARERAIPFYLRHGFTIESGLFEIVPIGPHKVMKINL